MAFGDWVQGLFQSEKTRGLSGGSAPSVALDAANPYYNFRLRRHRAEGSLLEDPGLLWYTSPFVKQRSGLGTHVGAEIGEGQANFTDVLILLSAADHDRLPPDWIGRATSLLVQEFDNLCRRENVKRLHPQRPLGVRFLRDGAAEMDRSPLGLEAGEFVTGIVPNLYLGPGRNSYPVIGIHLALPGAWEGYREVGRMQNDQRLFTLGSHWLDNYHHPALREAALYRLQQNPDGTFVHIVNPDLQESYQLFSEEQAEASVLTLARLDGEPVAHLVLVVIDPPEVVAPPPPSRVEDVRPAGSLPPLPTVAPPMLIDDEIKPLGVRRGAMRTLLPDLPPERILAFQERGILLQKVHFGKYMLGYDVYVGTRGEVGTVVDQRAATVRVNKKEVSLEAHLPGVRLGGDELPPGRAVLLQGDTTIEVAGQVLEYRDLAHLREVPGWPYVAEIRRPASSTYMIWGDLYTVGRARDCRVVLPDEPRNDNIRWSPTAEEGELIRSRSGMIPKSRFYTDSIMVSSEHASVDLRASQPKVLCAASNCYVYVRRGDQIVALFPRAQEDGLKETNLEPGDEVLVGNCLFHVGFTPDAPPTRPSAPRVQLTLDTPRAPSLEEASGGLVDPAPPRAPAAPSLSDVPVVPGGGAFQDGLVPLDDALLRRERRKARAEAMEPPHGAPPPLRLQSVGMDSILGPVLGMETFEEDDFDDDRALEEDETAVGLPSLRPGDALPPPPPVDVGGWDADAGPVGVLTPLPALDRLPPPRPEWPADDAAPPSLDALPPLPSLPKPPVMEQPPLPPLAVLEPEASAPPELPPLPPEAPPLPPEAPPLPPLAPPAPPELPPLAPPAVEVTTPDAPPAQQVVWVDDSEAQFELGRETRLVQVGWMVSGEVVCGNHRGAQLILPESRVLADQTFRPTDYFRLKVRGRRGTLELLAPQEVLIDEDDPRQLLFEDPEAHTIDIIRRDENGDEDFAVRLVLREDRALPDPRARLVALDHQDPLAAALVSRGLPRGVVRTLVLGELEVDLLWDGQQAQLSRYLDTYRHGAGFRPCFYQKPNERYRTLPEDGSPIHLPPGGRLAVGLAIFELVQD